MVWHPSGHLKIGVNDEGHLNLEEARAANPTNSVSGTDVTGLRFIDKDNVFGRGAGAEFESTAQGRMAEGFGVAFNINGGPEELARANRDTGTDSVTASTLVTGPACKDKASMLPENCQFAEASAVVGPSQCLRVEHKYYPSDKSDFAFSVDVVMTNECGDGNDMTRLLYQRVMDWDIDPTPFDEAVFLRTGTAADLKCLHDDGFCSNFPDGSCNTGINVDGCLDTPDEVAAGAGDHGAAFTFEFQDVTAASPLVNGASKSFRLYYGAGRSYDHAKEVMGDLGDVEAYSIGISGSEASPAHFFAFAGVGGTVIVPPTGTVLTAPCECSSTAASTGGTALTLHFDAGSGPHDLACA